MKENKGNGKHNLKSSKKLNKQKIKTSTQMNE